MVVDTFEREDRRLWIRIFQMTGLLISAMIGAGFASGREIWQFFQADEGLALFCFPFVFFVCCYKVLSLSFTWNTEHYKQFLTRLLGEKMAHVYDVFLFFYLIVTTIVMLAAGGATGEIVGLASLFSVLFISFMVYVMFLYHLKGVMALNTFIMPFLIVGLLFLLGRAFLQLPAHALSFSFSSSMIPSVLFTSFNLLPLVAVMSTVGYQLKSRKEAGFIAFFSTVVLFFFIFLYDRTLKFSSADVEQYDIPLSIFLESSLDVWVMVSLLWLAIITTIAMNVLGITARVKKHMQMRESTFVFMICLWMIPFTFIGFKTLVQFLYPLYGVLNLYLFFKVMTKREGVT